MYRTRRALVSWTTVLAMLVCPLSGYAQQARATRDLNRANGPAVELSYVTKDAALGVVVFPRRILAAPEMALMPVEVVSAAAKKAIGIDPVDVESAVLMVEPPVTGPPGVGIAVTFSQPFDWRKLPKQLLDQTEAGELDGHSYRKGRGPMSPSIYSRDASKTLIVATDSLLRKMLAAHENPTDGPVKTMLQDVASSFDLHVALSVDMVRL